MKKRVLSRLAVVASASAMLFASPAIATVTNLGTLTINKGYAAGGLIGSISNPSDRILFSIGSLEDVGTGLVQVPEIIVNSALTLYLSSVTARLYSSNTNTLILQLTNSSTGTALSLAPGAYYIDVTGTAVDPTIGGAYALALLSSRAAAAPGPAGLLFVGGAAAVMAFRRRREKKSASMLAMA